MIDYVKMMVRLKDLRCQSGLTQKELAEKIGTRKESICTYEAGKVVPKIENLDYIADYFDVSVDWLMGRTDKKEFNR